MSVGQSAMVDGKIEVKYALILSEGDQFRGFWYWILRMFDFAQFVKQTMFHAVNSQGTYVLINPCFQQSFSFKIWHSNLKRNQLKCFTKVKYACYLWSEVFGFQQNLIRAIHQTHSKHRVFYDYDFRKVFVQFCNT